MLPVQINSRIKKYIYLSGWKRRSLPISSHPPGELITTPFGLHKYNSLVLLFTHYLLQQTDQSDTEEIEEDKTKNIFFTK